MKNLMLTLSMLLIGSDLLAPPNCEIYKHDKICYQSCKEAMRAIRNPQGSYRSQAHFEKSIELCPEFAYSHMEKAVPYLKRGLFIEWKRLIDRAVELAPEDYLGYRGWCRLQFLRDYQGAIRDIEELKALVNENMGYCQTGDYHLNIVLAMCYKEIGEFNKARELFEFQLSIDQYEPGLFDYYHYGVLEYEQGNYQESIQHFIHQIEINDDLGETHYFLAMAYKQLNESEKYQEYLYRAEDYYKRGKIRTDNYTETLDKIYLIDIQEEILLSNAMK